jgi:hypothetical protein
MLSDTTTPCAAWEDDMFKAAGMAILFGMIATVPGSAQTSAVRATAGLQTGTELLATTHTPARKTKRTAKAATVQVVPSSPMWVGADPTKGPGIERLHQLQREGRCVIDEGYGRYTYCSNL